MKETRHWRGALGLLAVILGAVIASAQPTIEPDLRVVRGDGDFGPLLGTVGHEAEWYVAYFPVWALDGTTIAEPSIPRTEVNRAIWFVWAEVVNVGLAHWIPPSPWLRPDLYSFQGGWLYLRGLLALEVVDLEGRVVRERILDWAPWLDSYPVLPGLPRNPCLGGFCVGISAGYAASSWDPVFDGALLDITGLVGDYYLDIVLDPLGEFGQFSPDKLVRIPIAIRGASVWRRGP